MIDWNKLECNIFEELLVGTNLSKEATYDLAQRIMTRVRLVILPYLTQSKVEETFKEIEAWFFTYDGDGNLILGDALPRDRIVTWWQALKKREGGQVLLLGEKNGSP